MSIPQKSSFKFAELTSITGVKPYVLRFWETEFEDIRPLNGEDGQKVYSRGDVEAFIRIKDLLFEHKLSLQEAKVAMRDPAWMPKNATTEFVANTMANVNNEEALNTLTEALTFVKSLKHKYHW